MTAPSKSEKGGYGGVEMLFVKRDHLRLQAAKKSEDQWAGILA